VVPCYCGGSPIFASFVWFAGNDEDDAQGFGHGASNGSVREPTNWETLFKIYIIEPLKLLRLLRYPPVLLAIAYASVAFGILVSFPFGIFLIVVLHEYIHYIHLFGTSV
jgi:hypothetical protein